MVKAQFKRFRLRLRVYVWNKKNLQDNNIGVYLININNITHNILYKTNTFFSTYIILLLLLHVIYHVILL